MWSASTAVTFSPKATKSGHTGACNSVPVTAGHCFWSEQALAVLWEGGGEVFLLLFDTWLSFCKKNQVCYTKCLRRISMIKVWLPRRLIRSIFSAKPTNDSSVLSIQLQSDEIFSLFSPFIWIFFSLSPSACSPHPPSFTILADQLVGNIFRYIFTLNVSMLYSSVEL